MKIVILDGYTLNPGDLSWAGLEALGDVKVYDRLHPEDIVHAIGDADAVLTNKTPISESTLIACPGVKYIGVLATGYNVVDVNAAKARNIPVCNIPTYGTMAVAQFTFALLLELCHHVGAHSDSVYAGEWSSNIDWCYWKHPLMELAGKTIGIIGFGRIGQAVASIAKALGMKVLAFDAYENDAGKALATYTGLDELLHTSDVITLHCPLFPETQGIICNENIQKMKQSVFIINASRGQLVVEQDLCDALNSGRVAGAAMDVVSTEPIKTDNPLLRAKNCLITPHIAWAPIESRQRLMDIAVDNLRAFSRGEMLNNVWGKEQND